MKTFILYLTIALVGVGLAAAISAKVTPIKGKTFANSAAYNDSMKDAIAAGDVPAMPPCAETIEIKSKEDVVTSIAFICIDRTAQSDYIAFINDEYAWNISATEDRIRMDRQPQ